VIVAIMQPYFFPYIGYFQLMHAVERFLVLDDVQYVDRGWMNRNRIRREGKSAWISMAVRKAPQSSAINEREYVLGEERDALLRRLHTAYRDAPGRAECWPLIEELLSFAQPNVAKFNTHLLAALAQCLGIRCDVALVSALRGTNRLKGQAGIIDICRRTGADRYLNAIGGTELYDESEFAAEGIELSFIRTRVAPTQLLSGPEHLSIIDGLMQLGFAGCAELLPEYELLSPAAARAGVS
jgi:hypothetical protein